MNLHYGKSLDIMDQLLTSKSSSHQQPNDPLKQSEIMTTSFIRQWIDIGMRDIMYKVS